MTLRLAVDFQEIMINVTLIVECLFTEFPISPSEFFGLTVSIAVLFHSEYIKIIDGNGLIAFSRYGYSSSPWKTLLEINYGNATNVTIEIYFRYYRSQFKLQYGIVKERLQLGELFFFFLAFQSK